MVLLPAAPTCCGSAAAARLMPRSSAARRCGAALPPPSAAPYATSRAQRTQRRPTPPLHAATQQVASSGPSVAISLADVLVRDVMTKPPTLVRPDTSVFDVLELLVSKSISGVPVVDSAGKVLGMISGYDLLVLDATPGHMDKADGMFPKIGRCEEFGGSLSRMWMAFSEQQELIQKTGGSTAGEVCHDAATVADTARLEDAADVIVRRKVHRLAVVDAQGMCVGVLSRGDILKATLNRLRAMSGR